MTTEHKIWIFAIVCALIAVLSTIAYNVFTYNKAAQLYRECLELRERMGDKVSNWCYMR